MSDDPKVVAGLVVDVEPEADPLVERFGAAHVGYGEQYEFELHVHGASLLCVGHTVKRRIGRVLIGDAMTRHAGSLECTSPALTPRRDQSE